MSLPVFAVVLFAALLHATWNAIVKKGDDSSLTSFLVAGGAALAAAAALPFLPQPNRGSWPFIAASAVLQIAYFVLIARAYRLSDMSLAYPVMRGAAPLLVAVSTTLGFGAPLSPFAWVGIAVLCGGMLVLAAEGMKGTAKRGLTAALLNAAVIAGYTLIDGMGVRRSGAPAAYTLWVFLLTGLPLIGWAVACHGPVFLAYARRNAGLGLIGGIGSAVSYGLALWAMTQAPVAVVAALRETSVFFGFLIAAFVLKERVRVLRVLGVAGIMAGAMLLRLA